MSIRGCPIFAGLLIAGLLSACGSYVRRGSDLYTERRYVEAAEVFERTEPRLQESTAREKAEYGLYRGLTMLVLDDLPNAQRWLSFAYEIEQRHPGSLRVDRRELLDRGWRELGQRMSTPLPPGLALAKGAPPPAVQAPPPPAGPGVPPAAVPPDAGRRAFMPQ